MKYKVGDKVRIKSLDWYNKNKDKYGNVNWPLYVFYPTMRQYCGTIRTIKRVDNFDKKYKMTEDGCFFDWTDEMIEGLVEEETKPKIIEEAKIYWDSIKDAWICPDGYIFKDENGNVINATNIVLEKKEKEYPNSYSKCCDILECPFLYLMNTHRHANELQPLYMLLICRDSYWKIAGEEMGLGKPWKPDWDAKDNHFYTIYTFNGKIECSATAHRNAVLIFPTKEMRDAFYENFKEEIEICKELL